MNISAILQRSADGDQQAFALIVRHYQQALFAYLGRMGFSAAVAEELAQETFFRAWQHLSRFDANQAAFSTWLFSIARHLAMNEMNRHANRYEQAQDLSQMTQQIDEQMHLADKEDWQQLQEKRRIQQAMSHLPSEQRHLLALAYVKELSLVDIAAIEQCSVNTIKSRLHRIRKRLLTLLEQAS